MHPGTLFTVKHLNLAKPDLESKSNKWTLNAWLPARLGGTGTTIAKTQSMGLQSHANVGGESSLPT